MKCCGTDATPNPNQTREQLMHLENKTIAITGAAQGLGAAIAERLGNLGAKLALIDLNKDKLVQLKDQLSAKNINSETFVANVADETQVTNIFEAIGDHFGCINGLINNAGIIRDRFLNKLNREGELESHSLEAWQSVIDVNLTGVFLCAREASKLMIKSKTKGVIVNISSISKAGNIGQSNYSAAKSGVAALTVTWAKELARSGIRVGAIAPGFIQTEMTQGLKPEILNQVESAIPLGRMGKPDEIAHAVQFILENDYFSGRTIEIDGGLRI